jgi:anti-sigma factor RsiW
MNTEARLAAALGASAAPARDPGFTLAVMRAAEAERFREAAARSMLRWAALGAAAALLAVAAAGWVVANWDQAESGILAAGAIFALAAPARLMTQRLASAAAR